MYPVGQQSAPHQAGLALEPVERRDVLGLHSRRP